MHEAIQTSREVARGCGWRKVGGLYLRDDGTSVPCARLPIPCETCPCCGRGMKPARGWTWVDGDEVLRASPECPDRGKAHCEACAVHNYVRHGVGQCGLIWIGETHYPTTGHFNRESDRVGISRRLSAIPKDFKVGETIVMLAHRKAIINKGEVPEYVGVDLEYSAGIFRIFKPDRVEVVVSGNESDDVIEGYLRRGLKPVKVERIEDTQETMLNDE